MATNMNPKEIGKVKPPEQVDPNSPYLKRFDQKWFSELSKGYEQGKIADKELVAKLTRLASDNPAFRKHVVPLVREAHHNFIEERDAFRHAAFCYPRTVTASRWHSLTCFEKLAVCRKIAHRPILESMGLSKAAVQQGMGFMMYNIDAGANHSKFYEAIIIQSGTGYKLIRRWGALTDSGSTGRIDGEKFDEDPRFSFASLGAAKAMMGKVYATRIDHGYKDAFSRESGHVSPQSGKALPQGQYPVGLARKPGFGWGTQSITQCIPALRELNEQIAAAQEEIARQGRSDVIKAALEKALSYIRTVAHEDSTMGRQLATLISKPLRRVSIVTMGRFLPDPEGKALRKELNTLSVYMEKQLSYCQ